MNSYKLVASIESLSYIYILYSPNFSSIEGDIVIVFTESSYFINAGSDVLPYSFNETFTYRFSES
jgi:hypothetical protein